MRRLGGPPSIFRLLLMIALLVAAFIVIEAVLGPLGWEVPVR